MESLFDTIIARLKSQANSQNVKGMARYGISTANTLGVPVPVLRELAKANKKNHTLAIDLWKSGIHEARILAAFVDDPKQVTERQMEEWVVAFDSWDVCDQVCCHLFDRSPFAYDKAAAWALRDEEFVKRAGFVLMAGLAVHDKQAANDTFAPFFELIRTQAADERNFVKKAANWALRQMGKRGPGLHARAVTLCEELILSDSKAARWIGRDALHELTGDTMNKKYIARRFTSRNRDSI